MPRGAVQNCQFGVLRWPGLLFRQRIAGLPGQGLLMLRCPASIAVAGQARARAAAAAAPGARPLAAADLLTAQHHHKAGTATTVLGGSSHPTLAFSRLRA